MFRVCNGDIMKHFVPSLLMNNWFQGKKVEDEFVVCSPFIKKEAVELMLKQLGFKFGDPGSPSLVVYTSGNPLTYVKKSSDVSAIRYLSSFSNVSIHLLYNIHMKAYCIDREELLIGSGNWTPSGLLSQGNIEAAMSSDDKDDLDAFFEYCNEIDKHSTILDSKDEISAFCDELDSLISSNSLEIEGVADLERKISVESFAYRVGSYRIKEKTRLPRVKYDRNPSELDEGRLVIDVLDSLDISILTPFSAYFLGAMTINGFDVKYINGRKKIVSYYRVNGKRSAIVKICEDITVHANSVIELIEHVADSIELRNIRGNEREVFFGNKCGFIVAFDYHPDYDPKNIDRIFETIMCSSSDIKKAFLLGAFDSKGTPDKTAKLMAMDSKSFEMGVAFNEIMIELNFKPTPVNKPRERENPDQLPRWPQIRLGLEEFYQNIGTISQSKAEDAASYLHRSIVLDDSLLPNVKKM